MSSGRTGSLWESGEFEWEISKFSSLSFSHFMDHHKSPSFIFQDSYWHLRIFGENTSGFHTVHLKNEEDTSCDAICSLSIKTVDGTLFGTKTENITSSHYFPTLIYSSVLQQRKSELLPSDTLTIICVLEPRVLGERKRKQAGETRSKRIKDDESMCGVYKKVLQNGQNHDIILKIGDKEFPAHRDILSARSQVFESMLNHNMKEKNSGVVDITDCDPKVMEQFLLYIYCGKIKTLDKSNMLELYYTADKYDIEALKRDCCNFIKKSLSITNICEIIQTALNHSDSDLLLCATEYFHSNLEGILQTTEWESFMKGNFKKANELLRKSIVQLRNSKAKDLIIIE